MSLDYTERMETIAARQGGFFYPWASLLGEGDGEDAYTRLVESRLAPGMTVLEAGCGHGPDIPLFAPKVSRYIAYDLAPSFIALARESAEREGLSNVELVVANSKPSAGGRVPAEDQSVDLIISRRGPTNWIGEARRVARPGSWLIQINPAPPQIPAWNDQLPAALRFEPDRGFSMVQSIGETLAKAGLRLHSGWTFDVPEYFSEPQQLHAYLAWNLFHGLGQGSPPFEDVQGELEAVMREHAGPEGLEVRRWRYLWTAQVP